MNTNLNTSQKPYLGTELLLGSLSGGILAIAWPIAIGHLQGWGFWFRKA